MITEGDLKLESQLFNENTSRLIEPIEIKNSYYNFHRIYSEITGGFAGIVADLRIDKPEPIINLGSGPTMEDAMPYLRKWKGKIMCGSSQVSTLKHEGIDPDFLVILDPQTLIEEIAEVDTWKGTKTKLIVHTCVMPDLLEYWKWGKYYYREFNPQKEFYWRILPLAFDFVDTYMFLFSCSAAAQVGLAHYMGYEPQFLVGMDFSMPGYRSRCPRWYYDRDMKTPMSLHQLAMLDAESFPGEWKVTPTLPLIPEHTVMSFNNVPTSDMQVFYKRALMSIYRVDQMQLINTSAKNILYELPLVEYDELIETQGYGHETKYFTPEKIRRIADEYIATRNQFAIEFGNKKRRGSINVRFVESYNVFQELPSYMERLNDQIMSNMPDASREDDLIDVKANMERVESLRKFISFPTTKSIANLMQKEVSGEIAIPESMIKDEKDMEHWQKIRAQETARIAKPFTKDETEDKGIPTSTIRTEEDVAKWKKAQEDLYSNKFASDGTSKKNVEIRKEETDDPEDRRRQREIATRDAGTADDDSR